MDPILGGVIVFGLLCGSGIYQSAKRFYLRRKRFSNITFGVCILNRLDERHRFEDVLVDQLCAQGAQCILARQQTSDDVIAQFGLSDASNRRYPHYAIIGWVSHCFDISEEDYIAYQETKPAFQAWVEQTYPKAIPHGSSYFHEAYLFTHYAKTFSQILGEFYELFHEDPTKLESDTAISVRATLQCYAADGTILAAKTARSDGNFDDCLDAYRELAEEFVDVLMHAPGLSHGVTDLFTRDRLKQIFDLVKIRMNERVYDDPSELSQPPRPFVDPTRVALDRPDSR